MPDLSASPGCSSQLQTFVVSKHGTLLNPLKLLATSEHTFLNVDQEDGSKAETPDLRKTSLFP